MKRVGFLPLLFCAASAVLAQAPPVRAESYREEARVERVVVDAYVTNRKGDSLTGLDANDFIVKVDGKRIALESAEWISADTPEVAPERWAAEELAGRQIAPGRLIVFFFTSDRQKLEGALFAAIKTGEPRREENPDRPSLARNFDFLAARKASTPERGLFLVADALAPIPGAKSMLYVGWWLVTIGGAMGTNTTEWHDYNDALQRLADAR